MQYEDKPHAFIVDMSQFCGRNYGNLQRAFVRILNELPARKRLVLDFARVDFMSSSMIGVLVILNKAVKQRQIDLRLRNINRNVMEVFKITRLNKVFDIGKGDYGEDEPREIRGSRVPPPSDSRELPKTYVTNMNDQLDESGELSAMLPPAARKIAAFNTLLIDEATQAFPVDDDDSGIRCRTTECTGSIHVTLLSRIENLVWHCPICKLNGVISHWQDTKWDRTGEGG